MMSARLMSARPADGWLWIVTAALLLAGVRPAVATAAPRTYGGAHPAALALQSREGGLIANRVTLADDEAELVLELEDGRIVELALRDGNVRVRGDVVGSYGAGDELDRSWRELLESLDGSLAQVASGLVAWEPPEDDAAQRLDAALEDVLGPAAAATPPPVPALQEPASLADSVERLREQLEEMRSQREEMLDELDPGDEFGADIISELRRDIRREVRSEFRRDAGSGAAWLSPLRYVWRGLGGILSTLAMYAVLVGIGFAAVFFGRRHLERAADTARHYTVRSWLVGLAGSFLLLPAFILGTLALTLSIVGIPLLIVWLALFPVAVVAALLFGYLAVGHAAGEALAERRFYGGEWFKRANSYYYVLTGVGLLLALFVVGNVVEMAGPWFGFVRGTVLFLSWTLTWAAFTIGFGAVLLSRGGAQPPAGAAAPESGPDNVMEETHV